MALEFNGTNQFISIPDDATLDVTGPMSISFWILCHDEDSTTKRVVSKSNTGYLEAPYAVTLYQPNPGADSGIYVRAWDGATDISTQAIVSKNVLHHIVGFYNGTNVLIYADGTYVATSVGNIASLATNNDALEIGGGDANRYFDGLLHDVRIYNRVLSLEEIATIYYARGADNIVDGLVGRWLMNEKPDGSTAAGANVVIDVSGNGNHGTPANSPVYRAAPVRLIRPRVSFPTPWIIAERERNIVYDSILDLSKTRDVVYDSTLELSRARGVVYDSVLELSRTRDIIYDAFLYIERTRDIVYNSILELSRTRNLVYDLVLELSRERDIVYDSVLELSRARNIVYDSILELSRTRDIVYDTFLYIECLRDIVYDLILDVSVEKNIVYDLFEIVERLSRPDGVWTRQTVPADTSTRQDRPAGAWVKQSRPSY